MNFIKNVFTKKVDDFTHSKFIRYSMGEFEKEEFIIKKGKTIDIKASFEYIDVLLRFFSSLSNSEIAFSGVIESANDLSPLLNKYGVVFNEKQRFGKQGKKYEVNHRMQAKEFLKFLSEFDGAYPLLDAVCEARTVKIPKKTTPKIGSPASNFIRCSFPLEDLKTIVDEFLFDNVVKDFKLVTIKHKYYVNDIIFDEALIKKNPEKARKDAKRKIVIERSVNIDGKVKNSKVEAVV